MPVLQRVVKPKTRKGKKVILDREPKVVENCKQSLFINGRKVSDELKECIRDLCKLKQPHAESLGKRHDILPFENISPIEEMCRKSDASIFFFASSNKKRPNNLVLGRLYDGSLLDMLEFGVAKFQGMQNFPTASIPLGTKPCLLFAGEMWESGPFARIKSMFVDLFRGEVIDSVRLQGIEHVLMFTATKDKILMRSYRVLLKKSGTKLPRAELEDMGPSLDLVLRRSKLASDDLYKTACRVPQESRSRPKKNVSTDTLGTTHGRVHLGKQKVGTIQTRKMKGLRKTAAERKAERKRKTLSPGGSASKKQKSN